jgi:hypothetical protein
MADVDEKAKAEKLAAAKAAAKKRVSINYLSSHCLD